MFHRKTFGLILVGALVVCAAVAALAQANSDGHFPVTVSRALAAAGTSLRIDSGGFMSTRSGDWYALQAHAHDLESRGLLFAAAQEFFRAADAALAKKDEVMHASLFAEFGRVQLRTGDLRGAKWALETADARLEATGQPNERAGVWLLRGNVAKALGQYAESTAHIQKALAWFQKVGDKKGEGRAHAAECDLLQLQRKLASAHASCHRALALQPVGHVDRARTEKTLGLVYFFANDLQKAVTTHMSALKGLKELSRDDDVLWLREMIIDDQATILEGANAPADVYTPLVNELTQIAEQLESAPEVLWWRVSDARLRLADMERKRKNFAQAEANLKKGMDAFRSRPAGFEEVPDYATLFELKGLLARDQGDMAGAHAAMSKALEIIESIVGSDNVDVEMLREEVAALKIQDTLIQV